MLCTLKSLYCCPLTPLYINLKLAAHSIFCSSFCLHTQKVWEVMQYKERPRNHYLLNHFSFRICLPPPTKVTNSAKYLSCVFTEQEVFILCQVFQKPFIWSERNKSGTKCLTTTYPDNVIIYLA